MFINDIEIEVEEVVDGKTSDEVAKEVINLVNKSEISIEVLNGTSRSGLASSVAEKLKAEGYNVTKIGNYKTTTSISTSIINRTDGEYAKQIKGFLNVGKVKTEKEEGSKVDVTVILGNDYK